MGSLDSAESSRYLARFAAFAALTVGLFVLAGWTFGLEQLTKIAPGWPSMAPLTACAFLLAGGTLWAFTAGAHRLAIAGSALLVCIGAAVLWRQATHADLDLDQFSLAPMPLGGRGIVDASVAPATAIALLLIGGSLLLALHPRMALAHQALAVACAAIGWIGISRFLFGGVELYAFTNMALHTALVLLLLAAGILTLRTDAGVAALLASEGVGGATARRLLPAAVVGPLVAGALTLEFRSHGSYAVEAAVSVFALATVIVSVAIVWINAARTEYTDRQRRAAEAALRTSEERTQLIVTTALDGVITMNSHGVVTGWNLHAEQLFGWRRDEVMGRELGEFLVPAKQREAHRQGLARYLRSGVGRMLNRRVEISALHRDGHEVMVEIAITPIGFGDDLVFSAFVRDITGRTRSEAALRESEQRFRTTANAAPVLIWMSGPDKNRTWFNQRWLDFVGRSMEQEVGDGWCDNVHPADFDRTLDTFQAAFDARRPYEVEYRLQRADGAWRWLLERGTAHAGPMIGFEGYIGTCIDITEHRETVEQLRESRARFKTLTESLPQMIWTCLRDGYCDYLSRQWLDYTGRSEAQQVGAGWLEQVHPEDRAKVQMDWARVVGNGEAFDISFRIRRFDGVYRWFKTRAVPLRDPAGRILKWFGSNTDIEDFIVAERRLKVQLERMQLLDRTTHAIGAHREPRKVFEEVVRSLEENLGVDFACVCLYHAEPEMLTVACVGDRSAAVAMRIGLAEQTRIEVDENALARCVHGELVHEPDIENLQSPFPARLATGGLRSLVVAPLMIEDEVFGIVIAAKRASDAFGTDDCEFLRQLSSHVALAAHQARLYDALQGAYHDLRETQQSVMQQERLRSLGQIASGIAHDINNALSPAALYAQSLLQHADGLPPSAREQLGVIQGAIENVARTVQRMRAFYLPHGHEPTLAPVDLNLLVAQVIDLTRARWSNMPQERGVVVRVETELASDLPHILGAESEIRDALTNLLLNAVDAMPDGGTITCYTRFDPRDAHVVLEVRDTGIGMSETTRSRCLEPFFTTKGTGGSGLGLPTVFGMAQRHGAELEIDSELGRGTTMRLLFPRAPTGANPELKPLAKPARALRLLLVDDDPLLLKSLRDALELDEHEVVTAEGGQAGIDAFAESLRSGAHFDAVITDLGMPYVDGRKVATRVRAMAGHVPIIMLTVWGHRLKVTDDVPQDVDKVLPKPPKVAELRAALAELVQPR